MNPKKLEERILRPHQENNRPPFTRDKARILHSAFFRRLQAKKQILDQDVSDFGRTRLTHTLEVAQIATGIVEHLKQKGETNLPDPFAIEAAALAHDLGHSPNGHGGENALNYLMQEKGGFESNAQSFRIITLLGEYEQENDNRYGLNLTRATILGMLKYPATYSKVNHQPIYPKSKDQPFIKFSDFKPPKCIFDSEQKYLDWLLEPFSSKDKIAYLAIEKNNNNHSKTKNLNFFASIINLADDIAYAVHDLEDAIALNLISTCDWKKEVSSKVEFKSIQSKYKDIENIEKDLFYSTKRKLAISRLINLFVTGIKLEEKNAFNDPILKINVVFASKELENLLQCLKKFIMDKVILRRENQLIEFKLQNIIVQLFNCFKSDPERFLPKKFLNYEKKYGVDRIICDYISEMTDRFLSKIYQTLFQPCSGSIFDKL